MIKQLFKKLFCKHHWKLIDTIHGDEAAMTFKRSYWKCNKCGKQHLDECYLSDVTLKKYLDSRA